MDEKQTTMGVSEEASQQPEATIPHLDPHAEISLAPAGDSSTPKTKSEQLENARGWESENLVHELEKELEQSGYSKGFFHLEFKNPKHFTWVLVAFASVRD
jgi:hypothetical protein